MTTGHVLLVAEIAVGQELPQHRRSCPVCSSRQLAVPEYRHKHRILRTVFFILSLYLLGAEPAVGRGHLASHHLSQTAGHWALYGSESLLHLRRGPGVGSEIFRDANRAGDRVGLMVLEGWVVTVTSQK